MNKLRITLLLSAILALSSITAATPCGQQHAERCFTGTTNTTDRQEKPVSVDYKVIILQTLTRFFKLPLG